MTTAKARHLRQILIRAILGCSVAAPSLHVAFAQSDFGDPPRKSIVSISVCNPVTPAPFQVGAGAKGSCPVGSIDPASTLYDEHSTIFPPGTFHFHSDYLLFGATRTSLQANASSVTALTGGRGPDFKGQGTLDFAHDYGFYQAGNPASAQNGQIFLSAKDHAMCRGEVCFRVRKSGRDVSASIRVRIHR